jgi:hypothetical protein
LLVGTDYDTPAEISSGLSLTAGAVSLGTPDVTPTVLSATKAANVKFGGLSLSVTQGARTATTLPLTIRITNTGPIALGNVAVVLPANTTAKTGTPCSFPSIAYATTPTTVTCEAVYNVSPALAQEHAVDLGFTVTSADLNAPVKTDITADLRYVSVALAASVTGTINQDGKQLSPRCQVLSQKPACYRHMQPAAVAAPCML